MGVKERVREKYFRGKEKSKEEYFKDDNKQKKREGQRKEVKETERKS